MLGKNLEFLLLILSKMLIIERLGAIYQHTSLFGVSAGVCFLIS